MAKSSVAMLWLKSITYDLLAQSRAARDESVIEEYAALMREGVKFPPCVVYTDGTAFWLSEGFHRTAAAERAGLEAIEVEIRRGDLREAILNSLPSNARHGLRRTNADKWHSVEIMITNPIVSINKKTGAPWSNREIAGQCVVSPSFVTSVRSQLSTVDSSERTFVKGGKVSKMRTGNIGRRKTVAPDPPVAPQPEATADPESKPDSNVHQFTPRSDAPEDAAAIEDRLDEAQFGPPTTLEPGTAAFRARSILGGLSVFKHFPVTGAEFWSVYGTHPQATSFWEYVQAAERIVDDLIKEYPNAGLHSEGKSKGRKKRTGLS